MDSQVGIAGRQNLSESVQLLFGGGLNYSQVVLTWTDNDGFQDGFVFGVLGAGAIAEVSYELTGNVYLSGMLRGGYNFVPVLGDLTADGIEYGGGFAFTPAIGLAFEY